MNSSGGLALQQDAQAIWFLLSIMITNHEFYLWHGLYSTLVADDLYLFRCPLLGDHVPDLRMWTVAMADSNLTKKMEDYILGIPKAELHVHIEGTLEPELVYELAARNNIPMKGTVESLKARRKNFKVS